MKKWLRTEVKAIHRSLFPRWEKELGPILLSVFCQGKFTLLWEYWGWTNKGKEKERKEGRIAKAKKKFASKFTEIFPRLSVYLSEAYETLTSPVPPRSSEWEHLYQSQYVGEPSGFFQKIHYHLIEPIHLKILPHINIYEEPSERSSLITEIILIIAFIFVVIYKLKEYGVFSFLGKVIQVIISFPNGWLW